MKKSNSGIIAILANYNTPEMRKVLDLKITSGYPTITIPSDFTLELPQHKLKTTEYQHITVPPDLRIHISSRNKPRIWTKGLDNLLTKDGQLIADYVKLLTVVFPSISDFPIFTDRSYAGGEIIGFSQLPHWNQHTGFALELFAQKDQMTVIPNNKHYHGEQGAYMPWKYSDMGRTFNEPYKQGDFYIRQFAITNHDPKPSKTVTVYFGL